MAKTRYLQLTDTAMFEYNMLGSEDNGTPLSKLMYTRLKDGHNLVFSPVSTECESYDDEGVIKYKKRFNPVSLNTINHLAVPEDANNSILYTFLDPDYEFVDASIYSDLDHSQVKVVNYANYLENPVDPNNYPLNETFNGIVGLRFDTMRLYFVNGYDFSNVYGMYVRMYVDQNYQNSFGYLDLCDFFFTKDNAFRLLKYLASPILLGNDVYDRYIEIKLPCLYDLVYQKNVEGHHSVFDVLNVLDKTSIKLAFSVVLDEDVTIEPIEYEIGTLVGGNVTGELVNASFTKSSTIKGTVPTDNVNSDNIGCYIAEVPNKPYVQFYATWRDKPLTKNIVWQFNKGIRLYDNSLVKRVDDYDVPNDYEVEHSERKWLAMHEVKLSFCMGDTVIKEETYSMNQIFVSDNDPSVFYYRPLIFDEITGHYIDNIQIVYTMRFVNTDDRVQFVKVASLALTGNMGKYYAMASNLSVSDLSPYKVYNKIVENKQVIENGSNGYQNTKYIKSFYNSTDVVLDDNNGTTYGTYNYTLKISQAPKSYKFVFKKADAEGKYDYMDLTDGYYKLMFKDSTGATVLLEPTYSKNMNLYLGELEFNLSSGNISKLELVEDGDRKMSIVAYNEDGSVSSMFDFLYEF